MRSWLARLLIAGCLLAVVGCRQSAEDMALERAEQELSRVRVSEEFDVVVEGVREYAYRHYLIPVNHVSIARVIPPPDYKPRPDLVEEAPALGWKTMAIWVLQDGECWLFLEKAIDVDHTYTGLSEEGKQGIRQGTNVLAKLAAICKVRGGAR